MQTSELTGAALNYAVALAEDYTFGQPYATGGEANKTWEFPLTGKGGGSLNCCWLNEALDGSQSWEGIDDYIESFYGDNIIDREGISTQKITDEWEASIYNPTTQSMHDTTLGPTRRIAAMRCYVASKWGWEVDIPKELK